MRLDAAPATAVLCATYSLVTPVFIASERTSLSAKCPNRKHKHLQELESEDKVIDWTFAVWSAAATACYTSLTAVMLS